MFAVGHRSGACVARDRQLAHCAIRRRRVARGDRYRRDAHAGLSDDPLVGTLAWFARCPSRCRLRRLSGWLVAWLWGRSLARPASQELARWLDDASRTLSLARTAATEETRSDLRRMRRRCERELRSRQREQRRAERRAERRRDGAIEKANEQAESRRQKAHSAWEAETRPIRERFLPLLDQLKSEYERRLKVRQARYQSEQEALRDDYETRWKNMTGSWTDGWSTWQNVVAEQQSFRTAALRNPESVGGDRCAGWGIALGEYNIEVPRTHCAQDSRLPCPATRFTLPLSLDLPSHGTLLLESHGEGRSAAVQVIRTALLRMIRTLPAGRFRLTVIDPSD